MASVHKLSIACCCIIVLGFISLGNCGHKDALKMKRLYSALLRDYDKLVSPTGPDGKPLAVAFNLDIKRLVSLNTETQVLSLDAVISMMWSETELTWNPDRYGNISMIRLPSNIVWQPDIILYNSADQFKGLPSCDINMVITYDGYVVYSPLVKMNSFCKVPNSQPKHGDMVMCSLKFGSWTYDGVALDVMPAGLTDDNESGVEYYVDMTSLESDFNRQWELISATVTRNKVIYPCCPEPYIDVSYNIMIAYKGEL